MARQFIMAAAIYLVGGVVLVYWSLSGFVAGAPREDWALMIVLPLAWIFSFWPTYGSLATLLKIRSIGRTLERVVAQLRVGLDPEHADLAELENQATRIAAQENRLPEFLVRPLIRRGLVRAIARLKARRQAEEPVVHA